jgi:diguanylate cyclase (GGDEF)-like protein/PAS domain S-box-containing protein
MNKKKHDSWDIDRRLRERAEAKLASIKLTNGNCVPQSADELLHELRVHQIQLEMQNEELRRLQFVLEESRDRYIDLYEFAPVGYLTLTERGIIAEINLMGATLLGLERSKLIRRRFANYITPEDRDRWYRHFLTSKQQSDKQTIELALRRTDGTTFCAYLDCLTIDVDNVSPMLRITITDITQIKLADQQLRIAAAVFESQEGIFITDNKEVILRVNHTFTQIAGYTAKEVIGKTPRLFQSGRHDVHFYRMMWDSIQRTGTWKGEIWNRRKNGEIYPEHLIITAVRDQNGFVGHYVATFDDITQSKQAADEIERLAFYDPLTNLPNRRQLLTQLNQALASSTRHNRGGAILFIDLDNFKILNDTHGHHQGDLLLKQVAQHLMDCTREEDTVARLGGDEFVVILENLSADIETATAEARAVGEKILTTLNQTYLLYDCEHESSSSIGIVLFHGNQNSVDKLLRQADIAMYQAKAAGRNTLRFF